MTVRTIKFTPEVLLAAPRRSSAVPNAAGNLAIYSVSTYSFASHSKTLEIRALDVSSGQSTLITSDSKASEANWLGDGNGVVWLKEGENGNTSLIVADVEDPRKTYTAGTVPGPISNLKLAVLEEGKVAIAVSGQANPDGTLYNPHDVPKSHHSGKLYDSLMVRHWDKYIEPQRNTIWYGVLQKSVPHVTERKGRYCLMGLTNALKGTRFESPIPPFGGSDHFDISRSGILFVSKDPSLDPATHTKCTCYFIALNTFKETYAAEPKPIEVVGFHGAATSPVFSPDGKTAAFLQMKEDGYESDKNHIVIAVNIASSLQGISLLSSSGGGEEWDRSPQSVSWSNDGKSLLVQAEDTGRGCLFQVPLDTPLQAASKSPFKLTQDGYVSDVRPAAAGSSKLFVSSTSLVDNSLFTILDPESPSEVQTVSSSSRSGASFGLSQKQVDEIWFDGANGHPVHAWMVKPSRFKKGEKYPLAYLIHGGPQGAWGNTRWNPALFAEQGYVVITPNPTGSTGYGQKFCDDIQGQWGGLPYEDLVKGFEYIEKELDFVDTDRAVALGASYGGYMMNWINGHPLGRKFKALVTHDGVFSMVAQTASDEQYFPTHDLKGPLWKTPINWALWDPSRFTGEWKTPHLIIHNELDYRLCISEGLAAFNVLQMRGVESQFLTFSDENHWVLKPENSLIWHQTVFNWINRHVGLPEISGNGDGVNAVPSRQMLGGMQTLAMS